MSLHPLLAEQFSAELRAARSVLIGTHVNPDGDAYGSALALSHYLDALGIENEVLCHHPERANLSFLPGVSRISSTPRRERYDLGIVVDLDALYRLGRVEPYFAQCDRLVVIDHHVPHEAPGDLRIVETSAAATCEILSWLLVQLGAEITPEIANCLLTGIVTDTGSFRFRNTSAESLRLASVLLEKGADISLISEAVFQSKSLGSARLLGLLLDRMELARDNRISWSVLRFADFERLGAMDEDTEGFVNELLSISTVQIAALFREVKPETVRVSLRSRGDYDVAAVAREFGGGGHRNAAGCSFDLPVEQAVEQLVEGIKRCLESS